jgi:hypothetical protein
MDIELNITDKDINDVINSDPFIKLKVQNAALRRHLEAVMEELNVLKGIDSATKKGEDGA